MSDYIKREDAIKAMAMGLGIPYEDFIDVAERCMDDIPSADVVEVVRCKDCKHRKVQGEGMTHWYGCLWRGSCNDNDFCSYGERQVTGKLEQSVNSTLLTR